MKREVINICIVSIVDDKNTNCYNYIYVYTDNNKLWVFIQYHKIICKGSHKAQVSHLNLQKLNPTMT